MLVKIENVYVGKYDVDSIEFYEDGIKKEICFDKSANVGNYLGKSVEIKKIDGVFKIFPYNEISKTEKNEKMDKLDKTDDKTNTKK